MTKEQKLKFWQTAYAIQAGQPFINDFYQYMYRWKHITIRQAESLKQDTDYYFPYILQGRLRREQYKDFRLTAIGFLIAMNTK